MLKEGFKIFSIIKDLVEYYRKCFECLLKLDYSFSYNMLVDSGFALINCYTQQRRPNNLMVIKTDAYSLRTKSNYRVLSIFTKKKK